MSDFTDAEIAELQEQAEKILAQWVNRHLTVLDPKYMVDLVDHYKQQIEAFVKTQHILSSLQNPDP
jgi:hypothetical protein